MKDLVKQLNVVEGLVRPPVKVDKRQLYCYLFILDNQRCIGRDIIIDAISYAKERFGITYKVSRLRYMTTAIKNKYFTLHKIPVDDNDILHKHALSKTYAYTRMTLILKEHSGLTHTVPDRKAAMEKYREITGVSISYYRLNEHIMNQLPTKEQITIIKEK